MKKVRFKRGKQRSYPFRFKVCLSGTLYFEAKLGESMKQEALIKQEQKDILKLTGLHTSYPPNRNANLAGFRYNPSSDKFEFVPYFNRLKEKYYDDDPRKIIHSETGHIRGMISREHVLIQDMTTMNLRTHIAPSPLKGILFVTNSYWGGTWKPVDDAELLLKTSNFDFHDS